MLGILIIFTVITGGFTAHQYYDGPCPELRREAVDFKRLSGMWDEYKRSNNTADETATQGKFLLVRTSETTGKIVFSAISSLVGGNSSVAGTIKMDGSNKVPSIINMPVLGPMDGYVYWVLESDYDKYFIVWTCQNYGKKHEQKVYVKLRDPQNNSDIDAIAANALRKRGLPVPEFTKPNLSKPTC